MSRIVVALSLVASLACGTPAGNPDGGDPTGSPDGGATDAPDGGTTTPDGGTTPTGGGVIEDAMLMCAWAGICYQLPNATIPGGGSMGNCMERWMNFRTQGHGSTGAIAPYDALITCAKAGPADCAAYRQCLVEADAVVQCTGTQPGTCDGDVAPRCGGSGLGLTVDCGRMGATCANARCESLGACTTESEVRCAADGSGMTECTAGQLLPRPCAPGLTCVELPTGGGTVQTNCLPHEIGTCAADAMSCSGTAAVWCRSGVEMTLDCAPLDMTCRTVACGPASECQGTAGTCDGTKVRTCVVGKPREFDCATLPGGTCETAGTTAGCRITN